MIIDESGNKNVLIHKLSLFTKITSSMIVNDQFHFHELALCFGKK